MIPWIQVYSNLITHPKTSKLADLLKLSSKATVPNVVATGMLISIWTWAIQNAYNGDLSDCSDRTIADAARYRQNPKLFVSALMEAGWLDPDKKLHNWDHYATLLIEQEDSRRAKSKERVKRYRDRKKESSNVPVAPKASESDTSVTARCNGNSNVTVTECNASTIPNHTLHNISKHTHYTVPVTEGQDLRACFDSKSFSLFWETYPLKNGVKTGREAAWQVWCSLSPSPEEAAQIIRNLKAWKISGGWTDNGDRYIPKPADFLRKEEYRTAAPAPSKQYAIPKGASGELGEAELEAIQRVLAEDDEEGECQNAGTP